MMTAAKEKDLLGMTFTDHLDIDYKESPGLFDLDIPAYQEKIQDLQGAYSTSDFTILWGMELGLQPHLAEKHQTLLGQYPFDYVIGSSHVVHGIDPYYPVYFENRPVAEAYGDYYESILENILAFDGFDAYGHLDYIFRYGPDMTPDIDTYTPYADIVDAILLALIKRDKALEINTGAFRCGLSQPNPCPAIIRRYRELGGQLITLGSDAHKPEHVALQYKRLQEILQSVGFTEYVVYQKRVPVAYPLEV
jgi:histidinol-phosphatase (PHP family)